MIDIDQISKDVTRISEKIYRKIHMAYATSVAQMVLMSEDQIKTEVTLFLLDLDIDADYVKKCQCLDLAMKHCSIIKDEQCNPVEQILQYAKKYVNIVEEDQSLSDRKESERLTQDLILKITSDEHFNEKRQILKNLSQVDQKAFDEFYSFAVRRCQKPKEDVMYYSLTDLNACLHQAFKDCWSKILSDSTPEVFEAARKKFKDECLEWTSTVKWDSLKWDKDRPNPEERQKFIDIVDSNFDMCFKNSNQELNDFFNNHVMQYINMASITQKRFSDVKAKGLNI